MFVLLALPAFAQQDFSKVEIKVHKVAGTVYMLEGAGGNIGVSVGDDGILLVDDQYAPLAPKIKEALKGISSKPVKFVLNTHHHPDHTGGNETFGESAPIIAHTNVRKRLQTREQPMVPAGLPVITFDDRLSVHINGEELKAIHLPHGHTDGDLVVHFTESNVIHMGDDFFNGRLPYIDLGSGGSVRSLIRNIDKVLAEVPNDVKVIPGHGPLATTDDLRKYVAMLKDAVGIVEAGIKAGKTLDQLKSEKVFAKYEALATSFVTTDRFLETVHRDVTSK
jgi:glyoxylase-like metal-dependent hydrolase (beta-lactamase superfamily II)